MRRPSSKQRRFVILLLAIVTFGVAYYGGNRYQEDELPQISGVILLPAMPAPEFQLIDQQGRQFTREQLQGHWNLLLFDPNPASESSALLHLTRIHNRLAIDPDLQRQLRFIYIPLQTRDAAEATELEMGAGFFSLSGADADLAETFSQFGASDYTESHTLYFVDTDAKIRALFTGGQDAATIAADLITLMNSNQS